MISDVIVGHDGKPPCSLAGAGDTALGRYYDEVWVTRTYDDSASFKASPMGVFEVGLSWAIVFGADRATRSPRRALAGRVSVDAAIEVMSTATPWDVSSYPSSDWQPNSWEFPAGPVW